MLCFDDRSLTVQGSPTDTRFAWRRIRSCLWDWMLVGDMNSQKWASWWRHQNSTDDFVSVIFWFVVVYLNVNIFIAFSGNLQSSVQGFFAISITLLHTHLVVFHRGMCVLYKSNQRCCEWETERFKHKTSWIIDPVKIYFYSILRCVIVETV